MTTTTPPADGQALAALRARLKRDVEKVRYRLPLTVIPTAYCLSGRDWARLRRWKAHIDEKIATVRGVLRDPRGIKSERRRRTVVGALGEAPRDEDVILYCIGDFLLEMPPRWPGKWTRTLQRFKLAVGGRRNVTTIGRQSPGLVDTCLDQAVAVLVLAALYGIPGRVRPSRRKVHAYWEESRADGTPGSIVDLGYGWEKTRGLFRTREQYDQEVPPRRPGERGYWFDWVLFGSERGTGRPANGSGAENHRQ